MREAKDAAMNISNLAFVLFLPTIYMAFGAYYNMHPFSALMNDADIPVILESALLMASTTAIPDEVSDILNRTLRAPASTLPDDFALQVCSSLSAFSPDVVTESASYVVMAAKHAQEELLYAIFIVVACFIEAPTVTPEQLEAYAPVARLAAMNPSPQATHLLQAYVERASHDVSASPPPAAHTSPVKAYGWPDMVRKLEHVSKSIDTMEIPSEPSALEAPIFIVPLDQEMWESEEIAKVRRHMKDVRVTPFTESRRRMETAEEEILMTERARSDVVVPTSDKAYVEYLHFLREVERGGEQ